MEVSFVIQYLNSDNY